MPKKGSQGSQGSQATKNGRRPSQMASKEERNARLVCVAAGSGWELWMPAELWAGKTRPERRRAIERQRQMLLQNKGG